MSTSSHWRLRAPLGLILSALALMALLAAASLVRAQESGATDQTTPSQQTTLSDQQVQQQQEPIPGAEQPQATQQQQQQEQTQEQFQQQVDGEQHQAATTTLSSGETPGETHTNASQPPVTAPTESPSVQADVGQGNNQQEAERSQSDQQADKQHQVEQSKLVDEATPQGIIMRENLVDQQQAPVQLSSESDEDRFAPQPARAQKSGRANKRVHDGHVGVFGRKRTSSEPQISAKEQTNQLVGPRKGVDLPQVAGAFKKQQRHRHYYYQTLGAASKEVNSQQLKQQERRTAESKSLKPADFPEDYREILVQPDNLAASQEYEVQRQQQQQQQSDVASGQQTPAVDSGDKISEPESANTSSGDDSAQITSNGAPDQQQLTSVQQAEQANDQQQGFEQADDTANSASAHTPYIRLSNIATINSTTPNGNITSLGQSLQAPSGGEMKLMRIYVIDLDQKLVVSNAAGTQGPQTSTQPSSNAPAQSGEQQQQFEQAKISPDQNDEQREQTSTVYASTSLPQVAVDEQQAHHYDSSSAGLSASNSSYHERAQESPPTNHQQQQQVRPLAQAAKLMPGGDYVLVDRDSLQANLSQIMAQMGHYSAPNSLALAQYAAPTAQVASPPNHQPQNYTATQYYNAPTNGGQEYEQTAIYYSQQQQPTTMQHYGNFSYEPQLANYSSPYANNSRNEYLGQQMEQPAASAKSARAAGNWSVSSDHQAPQSDYGTLKQSVAYPAVVQQAHASHPQNHQQQAQFVAVYPALPQYIAPQYARAGAANSTRPSVHQAPVDQSTEHYGEWPAQGAAYVSSDTNYTALQSASNYSTMAAGRPLYSGPSAVQVVVEHQHQQQRSSAGGQLDKYQPAAQSAPPQHLFAYSQAQQQQQQPADYNSMYQAHPIGALQHGGGLTPSGEPAQPAQVQPASYQAGKVSVAPLDGHWKPVDLAASSGPSNSYGPAAGASQQQQLQRPAPRPINGYATQQPDHDIVSLSALGQLQQQQVYSGQQAQNHSYALVNGTGAHLIADGEHARLNYYPSTEQQQLQYAAAQSGGATKAKAPSYGKQNNGAYVNTSPEQQHQAGQYALTELAPSQQVHNHLSSHQAQAYANLGQYNGTGAQISTTDYHQSTLTPGAANQAAGSFGVTNEYSSGVSLVPSEQLSYTGKRYPSKQSAAHGDQSSSSDEAPRIPHAYSAMASGASSASAGAGNYRRPVSSYASSHASNSSAEQLAHSSLQSAGDETSASDAEPSDEGYETEQAEAVPPQAGGYSASSHSKAPGKVSTTRYFKKPYRGAATRRPLGIKVNYGQDAEAAALYQQQQVEAGGEHLLADSYQPSRPQGIRHYLSSMAGDSGAVSQQYGYQMQTLGRPVMRLPHQTGPSSYYRPTGSSKSLLSWETLSSVASGAAKRLPTAISSFLSPFAASMSGVASRPLYPTSQSVGYPNPQVHSSYSKSPHFAGDVSNFHRPYPFRHMNGPQAYSDATPAAHHAHLGAPLESQASEEHQSGDESTSEEEPDDLSSSSSSDSNSNSHADSHSVTVSGANSTLEGHHEAGEPAAPGEVIGDLAEIRPDGMKPSKAKRPTAVNTKTKGKRPVKPVISGDPAAPANSASKAQPLDPAQAAVLSSIEQQLEQQQQQQQQQQKPAKTRRKAKKTRPSVSSALDSPAGLVDPSTGLSSEQQSDAGPVSLESLSLEQQRLLLASAKANPLMGLAKQAGSLQVPPPSGGLMFGADGTALASGAPAGLNSLQIGQYKITPQTQFVQSIIEPSRQMLGQYFKQYMGQLSQLG